MAEYEAGIADMPGVLDGDCSGRSITERRCRHWRPLFARSSDQAARSSNVQVTATTTRQTVRGISIVTPKIRSAAACADIPALPSFDRTGVMATKVDGDRVALLCPAPDGWIDAHGPVDRRVGSPRNNGPELLESIAA